MEATEASQVEEFTRIRGEKEKLKGELREHQLRVETLANDNAVLTSKVVTLEARAQTTEDCLA